jgi:cell division protein FtsZ
MNKAKGKTDEILDALVNENPSSLSLDTESIIMVIGVGGAGGNAVNHMYRMGITGVNFVVCNTDKSALNNSEVENRVQMGPGLGAGNDPNVGRELATESEEQIRSLFETSGVKMLFIAAGMGGGTGTGASPVIAKIAHELGILTVAVVTMPFIMEGKGRYDQAVSGVAELNKWVDSLLVINNEKIQQMYGKMPIREAFGKADDILGMATKGIAELITVEYALVCVDFADVKKVMTNSGRAHMSVVRSAGDNRALNVAEASLSSPLLDDNMIEGAKNILLNFAVTDISNLMLEDVTEAAQYIQKHATYVDDDGVEHNADIIWGASEKSTLADDELELVVIATGFADGRDPKIKGTYVEAMGADPFGEGESIREPQPPKSPMPPSTPASITPLQKRYGYIAGWLQEPAYMRRKMGMIAGSDSHLKSVTFRPLVKDSEEETPQASAGVLF